MGRARHLPLLGVVGLVFALWIPFWHGGVEGEDFAGHVALLSTLAGQLSVEPGLPLWTVDWNAGSSLLPLYLHPLFSLALLSPFTAVFGIERGLQIGETFFVAAAALAMYAWCLRFGRSPMGALLAAGLYALHPSVFAMAGHAGQVHQPVTLAIVPLLFLAWLRLAERPGPLAAIGAAVASAALFLDMQRFAIVFPFALIVYAARVAAHPAKRTSGRAVGRAGAIAAGTCLLATGLVGFPALPALLGGADLQWHRPELLEVYWRAFSMPHLFALVDRAGALTPLLENVAVAGSSNAPGRWYQGGVAIVVAIAGIALACRRREDVEARWRIAFVVGLGGVALLLAFGTHAVGPRHAEVLREWLAGGRGGAVWLGLAALLALTAGAASVFALASPLRERLGPAAAVAAIALGVGIVAALAPFEWLVTLVPPYARIRAPTHFAFPLLPFWLATVVACTAPAWERRLAPRRMAGVVAALLVLHVVDVRPYVEGLRDTAPGERVAALREGFRSIRDTEEGRILPAVGYDPLADLLGATEAGRDSAWGWLSWGSTRQTGDLVYRGFYAALDTTRRGGPATLPAAQLAADLAGLANVRYVAHVRDHQAPLPAPAVFPVRFENDRVTIYENSRVRPLVQFYPQLGLVSGTLPEQLASVVVLARAGVAALTLDGAPGPSAEAIRADFFAGRAARELAGRGASPASAARPPVDWPVDAAAPCRVRSRTSRELRLACDVARAGYLVVAQSWSPRWSVEVDGEPRPTLRLSHAFLGVAVERGDQQVVARYVPSRWVVVGVAVSGLAWVGTAVVWLRMRRRDGIQGAASGS